MKVLLQAVQNAGFVVAAASGLVVRSPALSHLRCTSQYCLRTPSSFFSTGSPTPPDTAPVDAAAAATAAAAVITHNTTNTPGPITLLVASEQDAASRAMVSALLARGDWLETMPGVEPDGTRSGKAYTHKHSPTSLWSVAGSLLDLDDADRRWISATREGFDEQQQQDQQDQISDVVFLSRHVAKSGVPALCVHPIGVPNVRERENQRIPPTAVDSTATYTAVRLLAPGTPRCCHIAVYGAFRLQYNT